VTLVRLSDAKTPGLPGGGAHVERNAARLRVQLERGAVAKPDAVLVVAHGCSWLRVSAPRCAPTATVFLGESSCFCFVRGGRGRLRATHRARRAFYQLIDPAARDGPSRGAPRTFCDEMAAGEESEEEAKAARRREIEASVAEAKRKQADQAVEAAVAAAAATGGFTPLSKQQVMER
jgi:hypothetical protein